MSWPNDIYEFASTEMINSQLLGRQDGPADAYRHILATGEAVRQGYPEWLVRSRRKFREWDNPPDRATMDNHNNDIGIDLGGDATSRDDLLRRARDAINDGGTGFNDSEANWRPEAEWQGNPKNDNTPDPNDRLPTDQTNWPPRWEDGPSSDDPDWWHTDTDSDGEPDHLDSDIDGDGIPNDIDSDTTITALAGFVKPTAVNTVASPALDASKPVAAYDSLSPYYLA